MSAVVKLCGLMKPGDVAVANELKPDYVGFVFWPKSRRALSHEVAAEFRAQLDDSIPAVGVFVDPDPEEVSDLLKAGTIQVAQLHGHETEEYMAALRKQTDAPLWKAFKVRSENDLQKAEASSADLILLDNGYGTGETFDWNLLNGVNRPYLLAGGLTVDNAEDALNTYHPYGLDVSSGIETNGSKDPAKMTEFVRIVRNV